MYRQTSGVRYAISSSDFHGPREKLSENSLDSQSKLSSDSAEQSDGKTVFYCNIVFYLDQITDIDSIDVLFWSGCSIIRGQAFTYDCTWPFVSFRKIYC